MKPTHSLLLLSIIFITSFTCDKNDVRNIKAYYYPLNELKEGLTYEYQAVGQDSLAPDYWFYRDMTTDTAHYLLKTYYQQIDYPSTLAREEIVSNGVLLDQLYLFDTDLLGDIKQIKADVLSPNAFPFEIENENTVYLYKVNFKLPSQPNGSTTLIINRRFVGDTTFQYQGKNYPAIYFDTRGQVEVRDSVDGGIEPRFWGEEIFAKGLGLVAYRQSYDPNERGLEYHLVNRYTELELEKKLLK